MASLIGGGAIIKMVTYEETEPKFGEPEYTAIAKYPCVCGNEMQFKGVSKDWETVDEKLIGQRRICEKCGRRYSISYDEEETFLRIKLRK